MSWKRRSSTDFTANRGQLLWSLSKTMFAGAKLQNIRK